MSNEAKVSSVKLNFVMNFILTLSGIIFPLITFPYASRILLPVGTGKVAFVTSVVSYFTMIGMLGIPTYGIRACAKVRDDKEKLSKTVQELMIINFIMMTVALFFYILAFNFVPRFAEDKGLFMINIAVLVLNLIGCDWLYKGLEQYQYITKRSVLFKVIAVILMFLFVKEQGDYIAYAIITILASVGSYIFNFVNLRTLIKVQPYDNLDIKQHIRPTLTFFMMTVATTIYTSLDSVMLGFMLGDESVGYYNAAINIKNVLVSLVTSLGVVLLPRLSVYIQQQKQEEFKALTSKALTFVIFSSLPLTIFFIYFADWAVYFLSGMSYTGAIIPMQIVMPTLLFIGLSNLFGIQMLVPMNKETVVVKSVFIGAVVNLVLNSIFIPILGVAGAALGTLVAEFFVTSYQAFVLRVILKEINRQIELYKFLLAAIVAIVPVILLANLYSNNSYFINLAISAIIYGSIYCLLLLLLRESNSLNILKSLQNRRGN